MCLSVGAFSLTACIEVWSAEACKVFLSPREDRAGEEMRNGEVENWSLFRWTG